MYRYYATFLSNKFSFLVPATFAKLSDGRTVDDMASVGFGDEGGEADRSLLS